MEFFLNELSLTGQYQDQNQFLVAVREFESIFYAISTKISDRTIQKSPFFIHRNTIRNSPFIAAIERIPDKGIKERFKRLIYNRLNAKDWTNDKIHNENDSYDCIITSSSVVNTSLAEMAERNQIDSSSRLMINFIESNYSNVLLIPIVKNAQSELPIDIDCVETKDGINQWIENELKLSEQTFDFKFSHPPTDKQTILRDRNRFLPTSLLSPHGKRRIYIENETSRRWYVDNLHGADRCHLEVFDKSGNHIGEADLEGIIDESKADNSKKLHLK